MLYVVGYFGMVRLVYANIAEQFWLTLVSKLRIIEHLYPISQDLSLVELFHRNERWKNENKRPIEIQFNKIFFEYPLYTDRNRTRKIGNIEITQALALNERMTTEAKQAKLN